MVKGVLVVLLVIASIGGAVTAGAQTLPPTARELVQKLIKADVCKGPPTAVNAHGTTVSCEAVLKLAKSSGRLDAPDRNDPIPVPILAYKSAKVAGRALESARVAKCDAQIRNFGRVHDSVQFTVAKTWFTDVFHPQIGNPLRKTIGGKVTEFGCDRT